MNGVMQRCISYVCDATKSNGEFFNTEMLGETFQINILFSNFNFLFDKSVMNDSDLPD